MREGTRKEFWFRTVITAAVLVVAGVGYYAVDSNSRADLERAARAEAEAATVAAIEADRLCEESAETRQFQIDMVTIWAQPTPIPPDATVELAETITRTNVRKAALVVAAHQLGEPENCADGVPPVSRAGDYELPAE